MSDNNRLPFEETQTVKNNKTGTEEKRYTIILIVLVVLVVVLGCAILVIVPGAGETAEPQGGAAVSEEEMTEPEPVPEYVQLSLDVNVPLGEYAQIEYTGNITGFASADESIAVVSGDRVYGAALGTTKITAEASDGTQLEWNVEVKKVAYLTIDDWPGEATQTILDILDEYDIKATFFLCAQKTYQDMYVKIAESGHTIGNHSYSHDTSFIYDSSGSFLSSLRAMDEWMLETFDLSTNKLVRFPTGTRSGGNQEKLIAFYYLEKEGYRVYDWSATLGDAAANADAQYCFEMLKETCTDDREVILMHHKAHSAEALPMIIEYLHEQGYMFSPITDVSPVYNFQNKNGWNI